MSALPRAFRFVLVFVALQALWTAASGTILERLVIDQATVRVATTWIALLTPEVPVVAAGPRLMAPGGGINVLKGCEGTDILFLLVAAFAIADLPWRRRLGGVLLGGALVYLLNQVRIVTLFYAYRHDRMIFDQLHGTFGPLVMIVLVGLYFLAWLHWTMPHRDDRQAT